VSLLERLYAIVLLPPFGSPKIRAIKKSPKHYHLDWTLPASPGASFENLVAIHLLKWVHFRQDTEGLDLELRYFRDVAGREVDFVVTDRRKPVLMVECKLAATAVDRSLRYLKTKFPDCPAWQVHAEGAGDHQTPEGIRVAPALRLLETLT
jgi:predicted AAA+ superfamily ATPase